MWNAQRRAELVVKILRGRLTVEQAARRHDLEVTQIEDWRDRFRRGETAEHDPRRRPHGAPALEAESPFPALLQDVAELEGVEWPTRPFVRRRRA
jgi:transposase-like protein